MTAATSSSPASAPDGSVAARGPAEVLILEKVSKNFGTFQALKDVSFLVRSGTITALLGANGAGKTTLLKIITGLVRADGGTISSPHGSGESLSERSWFSYVPEESGLYDRMRVDEVIIYFGRLSGMTLRQTKEALDPWLERFKLTEKRRARVAQLSKGNQQKVKLICALLNQPRLLILDEPFTGLDGEGSAMLRDTLLKTRADGTTILLSSHRLDQMDLLADHLVVIAAGLKILDATLHEARQLYRRNRVEVTFSSPPASLDGLPGVLDVTWEEGVAQLALGPAATPVSILRELLARNYEVENFLRHSPDLSEIFHSAYATNSAGATLPREGIS